MGDGDGQVMGISFKYMDGVDWTVDVLKRRRDETGVIESQGGPSACFASHRKVLR